jgi:threonine/homoserine/homoserine lactone efflux protein
MLAALGIHEAPLFVVAALLLNLTPGADMVFVAGTGAAAGRRAGLMAAWGVGAGCLLHVAMAAIGLSALIAASPWAFRLLTWAGAAYLVFLGLTMLLRRRAAIAAPATEVRAGSVFWRGALTNALNPKVALFFLAFLPQFIDPQAGGQAWAFVLLGLWFTVSGTLVNAVVAWLAAGARERFSNGGTGRAGRWLERAAGVLFVGLGLRLALGAR